MSGGTSYGERLLRAPETAAAADAVAAEVQQQLEAALHGPLAIALTASATPPPACNGTAGDGAQAGGAAAATRLLNTEMPRRFIAAGACLSTAYAALAEGNETRVAGALLASQQFLFPGDAAGAVAVEQAVSTATRSLESRGREAGASAAGAGPAQVEAMQRTVAGHAETLDRLLYASMGHIQAAALGTRSWLAATGGLGPGALAGQTQFGPFLDGLVRWAFYTAAALQGIRADDWSHAGAALVAAQRFVSRPQA